MNNWKSKMHMTTLKKCSLWFFIITSHFTGVGETARLNEDFKTHFSPSKDVWNKLCQSSEKLRTIKLSGLSGFDFVLSFFGYTLKKTMFCVHCNDGIAFARTACFSINKTLRGKLSNVQLRCYHGRLDAASCQQLT